MIKYYVDWLKLIGLSLQTNKFYRCLEALRTRTLTTKRNTVLVTKQASISRKAKDSITL
jgi:hypothetical protein